MSGSDGLRFWPLTDVGRVRDHNEDSFLVDRKLNLFVVCDGMGGHAAGEVASSIAARVVRESLAEEQDLLLSYEQGNDTSRQAILELMEKASQRACSAVHQEGVRDESKRGMGTTLVALTIVGNRGFICHVGDSRIYLDGAAGWTAIREKGEAMVAYMRAVGADGLAVFGGYPTLVVGQVLPEVGACPAVSLDIVNPRRLVPSGPTGIFVLSADEGNLPYAYLSLERPPQRECLR